METAACPPEEGLHSADWQSLPTGVVGRVVCLLPMVDRCAVRLVCRRWGEAFALPEVWQSRCFLFLGVKEEGERAACYMQHWGPCLQHMRLEMWHGARADGREVLLAVEKLLTCRPEGMQLLSFSCQGLGFLLASNRCKLRGRVIDALSSLFSWQKNWLQKVDLNDMGFNWKSGRRLLDDLTRDGSSLESIWLVPKVLLRVVDVLNVRLTDVWRLKDAAWRWTQYWCEWDTWRYRGLLWHAKDAAYQLSSLLTLTSYSSSLTFLDIRFFFQRYSGNSVADSPIFLRQLTRFSQLQQLGMFFNYLNDHNLAVLTARLKHLNTLCLVVTHGVQVMPVTSQAWVSAVTQRPELRVELHLVQMFEFVDYRKVLVPGMPLVRLEVLAKHLESKPDGFVEITAYLARHYPATLETFHMPGYGKMKKRKVMTEALVDLVQHCPYLRCVSIMKIVPKLTVKHLAQAAAAHRSTEVFHIFARGFTPVLSKQAVQKLAEEFPLCRVHAEYPGAKISSLHHVDIKHHVLSAFHTEDVDLEYL